MKQKVIIFGAGNCGMLIANSIIDECEIICFIDNDTAKHGKFITLEKLGGGGLLFTPQK